MTPALALIGPSGYVREAHSDRNPPWIPPQVGADDADRLVNFFDHELAKLAQHQAWRRRILGGSGCSRSDEGASVLLKPARLKLGIQRALGPVQAMVGFPLPGRPVETPLLLFPDADELPADRPVTLERARRVLLPLARSEVEGEYALEIDGWQVSSLAAFLPPVPEAADARRRLGALYDEFGQSRSVVEAAVRAFAGSPPLLGGGSGLDSTLAAPGQGEQLAADAARVLSPLLPPWESTRLVRKPVRMWAGDRSRFPSYAAYAVLLDRLSSAGSPPGHPSGGDRSSLLAGTTEGRSLIETLLGGDDPVLRPASEVEALAEARPTLEALAPATSLFIWAHAVLPAPSDPGPIESAAAAAAQEIAQAFRELLEADRGAPRSIADSVGISPEVRQGVHRAALARARSELRSLLEPADYRAIAKSFSDSVATVTSPDNARDLQRYLRAEDAALSRAARRRLALIQADLLAYKSSLPDEMWDRLAATGAWSGLPEFEAEIDRLIERGFVIQGPDRRLNWVV